MAKLSHQKVSLNFVCVREWVRRQSRSGPRKSLISAPFLSQLRKPVVEKMRRDRINSSIEQLKLLLEKEFQRHQPNSKLEKADVLEVAVSYLKQQSQLQEPGEHITPSHHLLPRAPAVP